MYDAQMQSVVPQRQITVECNVYSVYCWRVNAISCIIVHNEDLRFLLSEWKFVVCNTKMLRPLIFE